MIVLLSLLDCIVIDLYFYCIGQSLPLPKNFPDAVSSHIEKWRHNEYVLFHISFENSV
jgi:hypothetical protein